MNPYLKEREKMIVIRPATLADLPSLVDIYNYAVLETTATFDLEAQTVAERQAWFAGHSPDVHPLIVAEEDGTVLGYSGLLPYRTKPAYRHTVELSIYVHPEAQGRGIGKQLMRSIIVRAQEIGHHVIIAGITGGNESSFRLHEQFGFREVGILREVGYKFGKWHDVHFYQLTLPSR
jgi:L-amino acid N-acyltransferase